MNRAPRIVVSIVSHGHGEMIWALLCDLVALNEPNLAVILTLNIPEELSFNPSALNAPVTVVRNPKPRGFGANHNMAFEMSACEYFCVLNPDVRISVNPFCSLISHLENQKVGVVAPLAVNSNGALEDNARRFPDPMSLVHKLFRKVFARPAMIEYPSADVPIEPDWVAGLFMLFRYKTFSQVGGFDEQYFLYYEDVDLCARIRLRGMSVLVDPKVFVVHEARRSSHRDLRFATWHLRSIVRFFTRPGYLRLRKQRIY